MNAARLPRVLRSSLGRLLCWLGAWVAMGLIDAGTMYAGQRFEGFTITWILALRRGLECHLLLGTLGLSVLWLARRFPLERDRLGRWLGTHLGLSVAFALAFSALYAAVLHGQMSVRGKPFAFGETFEKLAIFYTLAYVAVYWIILLLHDGWHYWQRYLERSRRAAELEGQLARAQLQALRMQLNPHFLFNTLNTIAALIHEQPEVADRTLMRLSELLRKSLDRADVHEIPLRQELEFLARYLEIEQTRFGDRLDVTIDAPAHLDDALLPALILQPVVENAIRHGIEARERGGCVRITAARHEAQLRLRVIDNGPGLNPDAGDPLRAGIGLSNTAARLKHLYGECQRIELRPVPGGGLEVAITLPWRRVGDPQPQPSGPCVVVGCNQAPFSG